MEQKKSKLVDKTLGNDSISMFIRRMALGFEHEIIQDHEIVVAVVYMCGPISPVHQTELCQEYDRRLFMVAIIIFQPCSLLNLSHIQGYDAMRCDVQGFRQTNESL